ncbi:MAG: RdgB/HAM1 family non-canonical purine NTP pyrophosphatase, partial [Candidatus Omnitrophota bacterium]
MSSKELVVATQNKKKLEEIRAILKGFGLKIISLADYPSPPRIVENGKTFKENAVKKAVKIARFTGELTLGEDSGLCVEFLGGAPGVRSARFSGRDKDDEKNNRKLLKLMEGVPLKKRSAYYACAVALADARGLIGVVEGQCRGRIAFIPQGNFGFGYDPLFLIPKYKKTFSLLGPEIKHSMSHRFRAL